MKRCPKCGEKYIYTIRTHLSDIDDLPYKIDYGCSMCGHEWTERQ